jgi:thymidylate synthase ThyX
MNEKPQQFERRIRTMAIDGCRFLLPASALANVGMTINARALEHAIGKMLSNPLMETRSIGQEIKQVAMTSVPTLLKYANEIPYLESVCAEFSNLPLPKDQDDKTWCTLVHMDTQGIERILAAALYREHHLTYTQAFEWLQNASPAQKIDLLGCLLKTDAHTIPSRELEVINFTFDLLIDQGAYFEIKRHRMMTQTPQHLTASLGYAIPRVIADAGLLDLYQSAMEDARNTYNALVGFNPHVASYIVPNGFNRRALLTTNLRSLIHFIQLRSAPNAHFSVRRAAQQMAELVGAQIPELCGLLGTNTQETVNLIEENHFYSTRQ